MVARNAKRLVRGEDFDGTKPLIRDARQVNRWGVCVAGYEARPLVRDGASQHWLHARQPLRLTEIDGQHWRTYKPLEDEPELFLRFARLSRQPPSAQRALDWCKKHGVLGLAGDYDWGWTGENVGEQYETLAAFDAEIDRAAGVLSLYEAALNRDEEAAEDYAREKYPQIAAELYGVRLGRRWNQSLLEETIATWGRGDYLVYALEAATFVVESTVRELCYPTLRSEQSREPSDLSGGWGFLNLRGAMYLQMYWLMAAGGNVARCKWCGGVIPLSSASPGDRKPRQDKKFCDDTCRQRHHYHKTKQRSPDAIREQDHAG